MIIMRQVGAIRHPLDEPDRLNKGFSAQPSVRDGIGFDAGIVSGAAASSISRILPFLTSGGVGLIHNTACCDSRLFACAPAWASWEGEKTGYLVASIAFVGFVCPPRGRITQHFDDRHVRPGTSLTDDESSDRASPSMVRKAREYLMVDNPCRSLAYVAWARSNSCTK
jgi:hypothetical protein